LYIILFSFFEIVALIVIVRLWMSRRVKLVPRLLWSVVLLVPFFGLVLYAFLHDEPKHSDNVPDTYRTGSSSAGDHGCPADYSGHSGDGH
jgi:hypothetical protein